MRYDFGSDNTAGMAPAALEALAAANGGFARAYGADEITARAADQIRQRLDADAEVRFVFSGTAANAIAVSMLAQPYEAVLTHHAAHICTDETGAPGFFGHGVGLMLAQTYVQQHHGSIDFDSRPGYTRFTLQLPVREGETP